MKQLFSVLLFVVLLTVTLGGQVTLTTVADVTGDGAAHHIAASGTARWIVIMAPSTNSGTARTGDANITTSRGQPIIAGGGFMYPPNPPATNYQAKDQMYSLANVYYLGAVGDKLSIIWGN